MSRYSQDIDENDLSCEVNGVFNRYAKDIRNFKNLFFSWRTFMNELKLFEFQYKSLVRRCLWPVRSGRGRQFGCL